MTFTKDDLHDEIELYVNRISLERYDDDRKEQVIEKAKEKADVFYESSGMGSRSKRVVAASSIYMSALMTNNKLTQDEVYDVTGVTPVTISSCFQDIIDSWRAKEAGVTYSEAQEMSEDEIINLMIEQATGEDRE